MPLDKPRNVLVEIDQILISKIKVLDEFLRGSDAAIPTFCRNGYDSLASVWFPDFRAKVGTDNLITIGLPQIVDVAVPLLTDMVIQVVQQPLCPPIEIRRIWRFHMVSKHFDGSNLSNGVQS